MHGNASVSNRDSRLHGFASELARLAGLVAARAMPGQ